MSDGGRDLTRDDLIQLLREVGQALEDEGLTASIYVVGGAAIALTLNSRRVTRDVDAALRDHPEELKETANAVGARHGLAPDWFNSAATMFFSSEPDRDVGEFSLPGLDISIVSPEHLLAMKIRASRGKDQADLEHLFNFMGISDPQQAADITNRLFDDTAMGWHDANEALYVAEDVFERAARAGRPIGSSNIAPADLETAKQAGGGWALTAKRHDPPTPPAASATDDPCENQ